MYWPSAVALVERKWHGRLCSPEGKIYKYRNEDAKIIVCVIGCNFLVTIYVNTINELDFSDVHLSMKERGSQADSMTPPGLIHFKCHPLGSCFRERQDRVNNSLIKTFPK